MAEMSFGAIFDWDGVVVDSSAYHKAAWELLGVEIGKPLPTIQTLAEAGEAYSVAIAAEADQKGLPPR